MALILILEDNSDMLLTLTEALELNNHSVIGVKNGHAGIKTLQQNAPLPDLIISDLNMPEMNGIEFLAQMRHHDDWSSIPIVIMSGRNSDEFNVIEAGASAFLIKPFQYKELDAILNKFL
jgi:DNA-binding response OmpR family regulator